MIGKLPPLYKFLDRNGARLTLGNGTFRHARPSSFNDLEDLTVRSVFSEETEVALEVLTSAMPDVIAQNLEAEPNGDPKRRLIIKMIQQAIKANPEVLDVIRDELQKAPVYDVEAMRLKSESFVAEINDFMQGYRILCVTPALNSARMWEEYAENGQGVALRIEGNLEKDSKFQLFRPVTYADQRPALYENTEQFIEDAVFGDREKVHAAILEKIIYTKTREWEHEQEYRLSVPLRAGEEPWETLPYHSEEVTELHIGPRMPDADREEILQLGERRNPNIKVFHLSAD
ncbi:DUF2971 domain-containing protein [Jannaschia marina]|uniref:DUF2971 domain-containing protein n=1 Tax=Jannaschia marina TaxID=2741674 RepID=UPI0015CD905B|nr:DUF2971 domain-containing protein [Jannaschia marina]